MASAHLRSIKSWICLIFLMIMLVGGVGLVQAQEPMPEDIFWVLLQDTNKRLLKAMDDPAIRAGELDAINKQWAEVDQVRLPDETTIEIDTTWLLLPTTASRGEILVLQKQVQAILDYQAARGGLPSNLSMADLQEILKRYRFDEEQVVSGNDPNLPNSMPTPLALLIQYGLLLIGMIIVMVLLGFFLRNLQVQPITLADGDENGETPTTAEAASELAAKSRAIKDYRAAIRYLYLTSLLLLDERGIIRYDPHLTNYEHVQQVRHKPQVREHLEFIVNIFDHVWYGFAPADEALYEQFRQRIEVLKGMPAA